MVQTSEFVRQQIEAMKAEIFELGLFRLASAADGLDTGMLPRAWDSETLLRSIAWLRLENMRGRNVYIRPQGDHHLSLVDDLSKSTIERMKAEGFVRYAHSSYVRLTPAYFPAAGFSWHSQAATGGTIDGGLKRNVLYRGRRTSRDDAGVPVGTGGNRGPGPREAR
jgi:hypothetical protein